MFFTCKPLIWCFENLIYNGIHLSELFYRLDCFACSELSSSDTSLQLLLTIATHYHYFFVMCES